MPDEKRVMEFLERVVADQAAAFAGVSTSLGIRLGMYRAMSGAGTLTCAELATRTGVAERYVREWLAAQVAGGYVLYDPEPGTYVLPDEHAAVLADSSQPTYVGGGFTMLRALYGAEEALARAYLTGGGVGWQEYGPELAEGVAAFFRPGYEAVLVSEWLPAMEGVEAKLRQGASVADVGCGFGHSTVLMARAFPRSRFHGFDFHETSVEAARRLAAEAGVDDRVTFEVSAADGIPLPGGGYDLVTFFDCLHDLGDPGAALRRAEKSLSTDGSCLVVEPNASAEPDGNIHPAGRSFASTSAVLCLPTALAQNGPHALGNHSGQALERIAAEAGLRRWRLAVETPTNRVYDVRR
ncbi:class I SAM-dependent methyltransferase [Actinacidiphila rubida]|uniref:Methyltransferase domain-containing protein n=1 Tax=Actinacidiphila rubida TaxID=310780 RepID=A0A1H8J1M4_9ACTN|nr:class I SAM-dependent methyltransferase [Actinacidiphila rubida]SEN74097.1 Methyltransferase domain-containing protein [Actinacidiphila rubida]